jgi:hypothetical protein
METAIDVVTPATNTSFVSLEEANLVLGTDITTAPLTEFLLDTYSAIIATLCNRVFAKETVVETFYYVDSNRLFLSRYPVDSADITSVTLGDGTVVTDYVVDEPAGKLTLLQGWFNDPVTVEYSGGYELPDDAPKALKQATLLLVQNQIATGGGAAGSLTSAGGIRMIAHKDSRVMYYQEQSSTSSSNSASTVGGNASQRVVDSLLSHYVRHWV